MENDEKASESLLTKQDESKIVGNDATNKDNCDDATTEENEQHVSVITRLSRMPLAGHSCVLMACILQTFTVSVVKALKDVDPFLVMTWRSAMMILLSGPCTLWTHTRKCRKPKTETEIDSKDEISSRKAGSLLLLRSLSAVNVLLVYYAVRHMPLGDLRMIVASTPAFVAIFARIFLKERCGIFQISTMAVTLVGVAIVMQPPFIFNLGSDTEEENEESNTHFMMGGIALAAAALQGLGAVTTRAMKNVDIFLISFTSNVVGITVGLSATIINEGLKTPSYSDQAFMTLAGITSFMAQMFMISALKIDDATSMSLARKSEDILVGLLVQVVYFAEVPGALVILGATLILACILLSGVRKVLEGSRSDNGQCVRAAFCLPTEQNNVQTDNDKEIDEKKKCSSEV